MNVLSLFDGISCGMVALERLGVKVGKYYSSEIDKDAIKISEKNYKNIIRLGDVTKITKEQISKMDKIDLLLAGSPCQGFSNNGKGLNFEDERSRLFFDFINILELVREFNNPKVEFLLENVVMKKEWENVITKYVGVKPIKINSKLVSAQNRPRIYWTNIKNVCEPKDKNIKLIDILEDVEIDYIKHEGLMICKSISENSIKLIKNVNGEIRISQGTKKGYIVAKNGDGLNLSFALSKSRRGRVIDSKSSTLDTQCNLCVMHNNKIRRYTLSELEKLQTLPMGYTDAGISDRKRIKAIGNGWTIDVIAHILKNIKNNEILELDKEEIKRNDGNIQLKWVI